jgi:hypothetical protein
VEEERKKERRGGMKGEREEGRKELFLGVGFLGRK